MDRDAPAGGLSWVLLGGYVLTMSVYAATFGHYVGDVAGFPPRVGRALGGLVVLALTPVDLRGVGDASGVEIVTVWGKLAVLALGAGAAAVTLVAKWVSSGEWVALAALGVLLLLAFGARPLLLRSVATEG